jgi:NAD(P)-dependent dehydrogenase (short-subunit alcohol dehydrogenase family)
MPCVLITGANRGLGLEHARQFAEAGWRVLAVCRDPNRAAALAGLAQVAKGRITLHRADLRSLESIDALAKELKRTTIDVLLCNAAMFAAQQGAAGIAQQALGRMDYAAWHDILAVNLLAPMRLVECFLAQIERSEKKTIVFVSSELGSITNNKSGQSHAYRTSKAALNMLAKGLGIELAGRGIKVVALAPGWARTDLGGQKAEVEPRDSVAGQQKILLGLSAKDSGKFLDWQGKPLPW